MLKEKLKAFLIHLGISATVVGCFLIFVLTVWYPSPLFGISGLGDIILILVSVDLVLGPLLTLVVFKPLKSTLKFDLSVIAAIQLGALSYGMFTIYSAHPLYVTYAIDRFTPVCANEVFPEHAKYAGLRKSRLEGPTLVYMQKPTDPAELSRITMEVFAGKPDIDARTEYYKPMDAIKQGIFSHSITPESLQNTHTNKQKLEVFLAKYGKTAADYAFLALSGKEKDVIWAWNRKTGKPVDILDIDPWHLDQVATNNQKTL